ncbi:DMT family transporter [Celeribacter indicus]|uniref:EamA domain-containing protein n=1 Tax=Celeribacter indicus TaxID=1208324 RepID=A0A0B5DTN8_9RHOB|nr:DMT family transporter [Celeribacter indicus]AJE46434.1 hypothetical protein P73_1719 [Celeribacter indicus]SDW56601.1 Permease of the drug/metabolite transporter (DMT) superfamily [Celeribacter indicus]
MNNVTAILLVIASMAAFTLEDMFIKLLSQSLPVGEAVFFIATGCAVIFLIWARAKGQAVFVPRNWRPLVLLRALTEAVATVAFTTALSRAEISIVGAVFQSMPLAVTLGAALFLGERVGWRRWLAIAVGFAGVLVIIRPGLAGFDPQVLWVLVAVIAVATRDLMTRVMDAAVPSSVVSFQAFLAVIPATLLNLWLSGDSAVTPQAADLLKVAGGITFGVLGYAAIVAGMRLGDASAVTPFRYTRLIFTMIAGVVVFGERPDLLTWLGSALIIASGLYTFLRERQLARAHRAAADTAAGPRGA